MSSTFQSRGRHRAPEPADPLRIARPADVERPGRHAEPEWQREHYDPMRDGDPLEWLGFEGDVA